MASSSHSPVEIAIGRLGDLDLGAISRDNVHLDYVVSHKARISHIPPIVSLKLFFGSPNDSPTKTTPKTWTLRKILILASVFLIHD